MVEDTVIGPFTIKQFTYIGAGAGLIVVSWFLFETFLFIPLSIMIAGTAGVLAFGKYNQQPVPVVLKNFVFFLIRPRLFLWKHTIPTAPEPIKEVKKEAAPLVLPGVGSTKLSDLAWSLDIKKDSRNNEES